MNKYEKLEKIQTLLEKGTLSAQEFEQEKFKILNEKAFNDFIYPISTNKPFGLDVNIYCMLMHLAQLFNGIGFIAILVMWLMNKEKYSEIDKHGKAIFNWTISLIIYLTVLIFLIPLTAFLQLELFVVLISVVVVFISLYTIFILLGAVAAYRGKLFKYPFTIKFLK